MRIAVALLVFGFVVPICSAQAEKPEPNSLQDFLHRPVEDCIAALKNKDSAIRQNAAAGLAFRKSVSDSAIPELIEALADKDEQVRIGVASCLNHIGEQARRALPALRAALKDRSVDVRLEAADALRRLSAREKVVPVLRESLGAEDDFIRLRAAFILADIPWKAQSAVEPLLKCLRNKKGLDRVEAAHALWLINRDPAAAAALLELAKSSPENAVKYLGLPGLDGAAVMPILRKALEDKESLVRGNAALALGTVDAPIKERLALLQTAMKDCDVGVRQEAAMALQHLGPAAAPAVPLLIAALRDGNKLLRQVALYTLCDIGSAAAPAVPALVELLRSGDRGDRGRALLTLLLIGSAAREALPVVRAKLTDADPPIRLLASAVVWRIDNDAKARQRLLEATKDKNAQIRKGVAAWLADIGPAAKEMLPHLRPLLRDATSEVRLYAARGLWRIGKDESAIAVLIDLLQDKHSQVRRQSAEELGDVGAAAKKAVPALKRALDDEDGDVQRTAYEALQKIAPPKGKP